MEKEQGAVFMINTKNQNVEAKTSITLLLKMKPVIAMIAALVVALIRFVPESSFIMEFDDAQGGGAMAYAMCMAVLVTALVFLATSLLFKDSLVFRILAVFLIVVSLAFQINRLLEINDISNSLHAAGDSASPPDLLRSLYKHRCNLHSYRFLLYDSLASNAGSPEDLLRDLYETGRFETKFRLASNPATPADILVRLGGEDNKWIKQALARNPKIRREVRKPE